MYRRDLSGPIREKLTRYGFGAAKKSRGSWEREASLRISKRSSPASSLRRSRPGGNRPVSLIGIRAAENPIPPHFEPYARGSAARDGCLQVFLFPESLLVWKQACSAAVLSIVSGRRGELGRRDRSSFPFPPG